MDELTPEQIYVQMQHTRRTWLGMEALEKERELQCKRGSTFDLTNGIDQQEKKQALLEKADTVILMLCQAELLSVMKEDLNTIQKSGKKICLIVSKESGWDIADRETMQRELEGSPIGDYYEIETSTPEGLQKVLAEHLPKNLPGAELPDSRSNGLLLAYGEDSFLLCRSLPLETIVHGTPSGYFTRALTNQFGFDAACVVYVPAHFDIVSWVP